MTDLYVIAVVEHVYLRLCRLLPHAQLTKSKIVSEFSTVSGRAVRCPEISASCGVNKNRSSSQVPGKSDIN